VSSPRLRVISVPQRSVKLRHWYRMATRVAEASLQCAVSCELGWELFAPARARSGAIVALISILLVIDVFLSVRFRAQLSAA
jgi:hypothetical protein